MPQPFYCGRDVSDFMDVSRAPSFPVFDFSHACIIWCLRGGVASYLNISIRLISELKKIFKLFYATVLPNLWCFIEC